MSDKPDLKRLFDLMDKARDADHRNYEERYCLLVEHIRNLDLLHILEERFSELAGENYDQLPAYSLNLVGSTTSELQYYELRLLFLKKLINSEDIRSIIYHETYNFGNEYDQFTRMFDALIEPIGAFIKQFCRDLFHIDDSPFGFNPQYVVDQVNDWIKRESWLITDPKYFHDRDFEEDDKLFFVIGAFENLHGGGVLNALKAATEHAHLAPFRIKVQDANMSTASRITDDIWKFICSAKGIIVDLCETNFNVAYEVGIAHALGKSTIFLANTDEYKDFKKDLPFDIDDIRVVPYKCGELDKLTEDVVEYLLYVLAEKEFSPKTGINIRIE